MGDSELRQTGASVRYRTLGRGCAGWMYAGAQTEGPGFDILMHREERFMSIGTIALIVLVLILIGVIPSWPHSRSWGYGPSGIVGVIVLVLIVLFLMGRL
jgi:Protein of unknown function (DUF3309)